MLPWQKAPSIQNLRQVPLEQVHHSNLDIANKYDQLRKNKACNESKGYNKLAQQIKKCEKVYAIHISKINLVRMSGNIISAVVLAIFSSGTYAIISTTCVESETFYEKYHEKKTFVLGRRQDLNLGLLVDNLLLYHLNYPVWMIFLF